MKCSKRTQRLTGGLVKYVSCVSPLVYCTLKLGCRLDIIKICYYVIVYCGVNTENVCEVYFNHFSTI